MRCRSSWCCCNQCSGNVSKTSCDSKDHLIYLCSSCLASFNVAWKMAVLRDSVLSSSPMPWHTTSRGSTDNVTCFQLVFVLQKHQVFCCYGSESGLVGDYGVHHLLLSLFLLLYWSEPELDVPIVRSRRFENWFGCSLLRVWEHASLPLFEFPHTLLQHLWGVSMIGIDLKLLLGLIKEDIFSVAWMDADARRLTTFWIALSICTYKSGLCTIRCS